MFEITYDGIEDLREKLNEANKNPSKLVVEEMEDGSFKANIYLESSGRQELIYKNGSISKYSYYDSFDFPEDEFKRDETMFNHKGREYHRTWSPGSNNRWWDGEFYNGVQHGKQRWWWGHDTVQKETIYSDGEFVKSYDYQGASHHIEYGRMDEFFEALRRAQVFDEDIEFKNSEPGPCRKLIGFVSNNIWHYICVVSFNKILDLMGAKVHLREWSSE